MGSDCCTEPDCRRHYPISLYLADFSDRVYAVTRRRVVSEREDGTATFAAVGRHDVTAQLREFIRGQAVAEMRTLSVQQPWAWAIATQGKNVENRTWHTTWGPRSGDDLLAIHASGTFDDDAQMPTERAARVLRVVRAQAQLAQRLPGSATHLRLGRVVAVARFGGCHHARDCVGSVWVNGQDAFQDVLCSPWAVWGQWHWVLTDARPLPEPVPCKGRLGLWRLPADVDKAVREQLDAGAR